MTDNIKAKGETPEESIVSMIENEKQLIKEFTLKFFFWWYNQKGTNTSQGFNSYMETVEGMLEFNKLIAGRSKSIESEKAKDERIKELEEGLDRIVNPIKYMQIDAENEGANLDGQMAIYLSKDSSYLQSIAKKCLENK